MTGADESIYTGAGHPARLIQAVYHEKECFAIGVYCQFVTYWAEAREEIHDGLLNSQFWSVLQHDDKKERGWNATSKVWPLGISFSQPLFGLIYVLSPRTTSWVYQESSFGAEDREQDVIDDSGGHKFLRGIAGQR